MSVVTNLLTANDASFDVNVGTWTAGTNTSVARTTAHFESTPAALRLTSAGSGTMAAFSGKYAVSPSTVYEAYCHAGNATSVAGRIVSIKIDWYTSGDVYISSSTTTTPASLPNATTWSTAIVVIDTSPVNAAKASLQVNVTAGITGAGQSVDIDTLALGLPVVDTGNLIPYATSSVEMDVSGWGVSNGTIARGSAGAEGVYNLTATSTASGDMPVTSATRFPVVVGTAYEMYVWTTPPAASRSLILDIRWYTAVSGGSLVSTSTRTATTVQTGTWERHTVLGTAPATATHAEVRVRPQAVGAAEVWYLDRFVLRAQPLITGNLIPYSAQSLEVDVTDWTAAGNCSIARSAPAEMAYAGAYSMKVTATAAGQARIELATAVAVTAGTYYNAGVQFRTVGASPASAVWLGINWYDPSDVYLGSAEPDQESTQVGGAWHMETLGRQAPVGATKAKLVLLPQATVPAQVFYLDEISLVAGTPPYIVEANPSTGSVSITLNDLAGQTTVELYRIDPDGTAVPVRGYTSGLGEYDVTGATMLFEDYETPLGVAVRYQYTRHPAGTTTRTYSVTVDPPSSTSYVWLTDPGQPGRNQLVMVEKPPSWDRAIARGVYPIRGAEMPVVLSDVRQSRTGTIQLLSWTEDEENAIAFLLATGSTLLLRARRGWGLDHIYVSVGDVGEPRPVDSGWVQLRRWVLPLTEVGRPIGGIAGSATRTWQDVLDDPETPTWADVLEKYPTWLDVLQGVD